MTVCQSCRREIVRPGQPQFDGVSHGICLPCFTLQLGDVKTQSLAELASDELELLPSGAILLDAELRVVGYNAAETRITGLAREKVLGRRFFVDIAPCMDFDEVGQWCVHHVHDAELATQEVDWVLELRDGKRLAALTCIAGRGRVALTVTLYPLEVGTITARTPLPTPGT